MKSALEWYLGIEPAQPGEGTAWNVITQTPWPVGWPGWLALLIGTAAFLLVVRVSWRETENLSRLKRLSLLGLRMVSVCLVLVFLTGLAVIVERTGLPLVVVMVDDSASMALVDQYDAAADRDAVRRILTARPASTVSRFDIARGVLSHDQGEFLRELDARYRVRLYRFSESALPLAASSDSAENSVPEWLDELATISPEGQLTRPGLAVRKVLDDLRGTPPAAIILLTDGIASGSDADKLSTAIPNALRMLVPIYTIGLGSSKPQRDLQLFDTVATDVAFVDDPIDFSARIRAFGLEAESAEVTLRRQGENNILARKTVTIPSDGKPLRIELAYSPEEDGEFDFVLSAKLTDAAGASRPETDLANNSEIRHVSVRRQKIRVLLADSIPRYEFRFVKHLLERDQSVELHTVLQQADIEFASEDETALPRFPVKRSDLFLYDAIIIGDVDTNDFSPGLFEDLRDFVRDAGGGIIFIAGEQFNPTAFRGTLLEPMLPVDLDAVDRDRAALSPIEAFRPKLTQAGSQGTSIFRFSIDDDENRDVWAELPELNWLITAPVLRPGAIVLLEHPARSAETGNLPVIATQRFGAGKVLFHATDELYRWRFRAGDRYYGRYWIQAIRYLARSRLLGRSRSAELTTDRLKYDIGESVVVRLRFFDERLVPAAEGGVTIALEARNQQREQLTLKRIPSSETIFETSLPKLNSGTYRAWVASPAFDETPPSASFRVETPDRELQVRTLDAEELQRAARTTHGGYFSPANALDVPSEIPAGFAVPLDAGAPIPIWNRWELLILFMLSLSGEWFLRKHSRLI